MSFETVNNPSSKTSMRFIKLGDAVLDATLKGGKRAKGMGMGMRSNNTSEQSFDGFDELFDGASEVGFAGVSPVRGVTPGSRGGSRRRGNNSNSSSSRAGSPSKASGGQGDRLNTADSESELQPNSPLSGIHEDEIEAHAFIATMLLLTAAIENYAINRNELLNVKRASQKKSIELEDVKIACREATTRYQTAFNMRQNSEKNLIALKKKSRMLNNRVHRFKEKVRVARLLNVVSVNGHTAISWAATLGSFDIVEEMLSRGSTVGYPAEMMNMSAAYLQQSWAVCKCAMSGKPQRRQDEVMSFLLSL
jgi:hypothetical protein